MFTNRQEVQLRRVLLRTDWGYPRDPALSREAESQGFRRPPPAQVGAVLLIGWVGGLGCLLRAERAARAQASLALGEAARLAWREAQAEAVRRTSLAEVDRRAPTEPPAVSPLFAPAPILLADQASYGLAFLLALASERLQIPVAPGCAATGTLLPGGRIGPVEGLEAKVQVVNQAALGITRLMVPAGQGAEARAVVTRADLEVIEVHDTATALQLAFPEAERTLALRWRADPERAERAAEALYRATLRGERGLLSPAAQEEAARELRATFPPGSPRAERARLAEAIAARHQGRPTLWKSELPLTLLEPNATRRWEIRAHLVQAANDSAEAVEATCAEHEAALNEVVDWMPPHLKLLGALGRARLACQDLPRAKEHLQRAVAGWFDEGDLAAANYSLCALLLAAGLDDDPLTLDALEAHEVPAVLSSGALTADDVNYLHLALGRARVQAGRAALAADVLSPEAARAAGGLDWADAPAHLRFSAERWRAAAERALGPGREGPIAAHPSEGDLPPARLLARVDAASAARDQAALAQLEEAVRRHPRLKRELGRYREAGRSPLESLARWYPY